MCFPLQFCRQTLPLFFCRLDGASQIGAALAALNEGILEHERLRHKDGGGGDESAISKLGPIGNLAGVPLSLQLCTEQTHTYAGVPLSLQLCTEQTHTYAPHIIC